MTQFKVITTFGEHLRILRETAGLTLKEVATNNDIDISLLAKIERNERQPTKQWIKKIAKYFKIDETELLNEFLSDQIAYKILDDESDLSILKAAEQKIKYRITNNK